jgi:DNA polymerase-3 subunit alpha/error-prone DNA polymerase
VITPKLLKIPNVSLPNVILNSNLKHPKNKTYYTDSGENDMQLLTRLANEGLLRIYGNTNVLARARVEKELKVIDELKFSGYF